MKWVICLCGMILGLKPERLEIMPVGFAVSFKVDTKNYNRKILNSNLLSLKKLVIAMSGPLVNLIFIVLFLCIFQNITLVYVNILIFMFNMVMIYPLDGGRILKYILCFILGKQRAMKVTNIISNIITIIITIGIFYLSFITQNIAYTFVLVYIWIIRIKENKKYKIKIRMYKILENYIAINND